jgi:hypothetical protein
MNCVMYCVSMSCERIPFLSSLSLPLFSSGNDHQPSRCHAAPVRSRLSVFSLLRHLANHFFPFTLDAVTIRATTTCRTDLDLVVGVDLYLWPSSCQSGGVGHRGRSRRVFPPVFAFSRPNRFLFPLTSAQPAAHAILMGLLPASSSPTSPLYLLHLFPLSRILTLWMVIPISTLLAATGACIMCRP